jgi:hypothetical protein
VLYWALSERQAGIPTKGNFKPAAAPTTVDALAVIDVKPGSPSFKRTACCARATHRRINALSLDSRTVAG